MTQKSALDELLKSIYYIFFFKKKYRLNVLKVDDMRKTKTDDLSSLEKYGKGNNTNNQILMNQILQLQVSELRTKRN